VNGGQDTGYFYGSVGVGRIDVSLDPGVDGEETSGDLSDDTIGGSQSSDGVDAEIGESSGDAFRDLVVGDPIEIF